MRRGDRVKTDGATGLILATVNGYQQVVELILQNENVDIEAKCNFRHLNKTYHSSTAFRIAQLLKFGGIEGLFERYKSL